MRLAWLFRWNAGLPSIVTAPNGKRRRIYQRWATPWELLEEVAKYEALLRQGVSTAELGSFAQRQSDTEAAMAMQRGKRELFAAVKRKQTG